MCFGGGGGSQQQTVEAAPAPAQPEQSPIQQQIAQPRQTEDVQLYGSVKGPKTVRSNTAGVNTSNVEAGIKV